jgi:hypothetical protein
MIRSLLLMATALVGLPGPASAVVFPLRTAANGRFLTDQHGEPFLVVGDTAWSLIVQLGEDDIDRYLEDRQKRGFNSIIVNLIEHKFAPEANHEVVTGGYGEGVATALTARTADKKLSITYIPSTGTESRKVTMNLSRFSGPITARWYNPTDGRWTAVNDVPLHNQGSHDFHTPGDNGTRTNDWVLVLQVR